MKKLLDKNYCVLSKSDKILIREVGLIINIKGILNEGQATLLSHRRIEEENIKMDYKDVGYESTDCSHLTQNRDQWRGLMNNAMNNRVP
jgi:hypothetical protein